MGYLNRLWAYGLYRGSRLFRRRTLPLKQLASNVLVIEPASSGSYPPPVTLDGQIERATGNLWEPLENIINYAQQIHMSHKETLLYQIEKITIDNGFLYKENFAEYVSSLGIPKPDNIKNENEGILCSTPSGSLYFGCWMYGDNLLEGIAKDINQNTVKVRPHKNYFHLTDLNNFLELSNEYLNHPTSFDTLYIPEDIGYNQSKVKRIKVLRSKYNFANHKDAPKKMIYLKRGKSANARILSNETEITQYLKALGFKIIDPEQHTVKELVEETSNSDIVLGVEGSQLTYGLLGLKEGGYILELMPPWHFQATDRPRCESVGVRWGFLVGIENKQGFEIPLDDVKRLLEKVL